MAGHNTCNDCRHNQGGYCTYYEKRVSASNRACPEYEEK